MGRILIQATASQIVSDNDICNGIKYELDVICIGGARHVAVDFLCCRLILRLELGLDVGGRLAVLLSA